MFTPAKTRFFMLAAAGPAAVLLAGCAAIPTSVVAEGAKWEEVSRAGMLFGEGPVAARDGKIYATDITITAVIKAKNPGGTIYRYDPATGVTSKYMEPSGMANGLHVDRNGDLIIAQGADTGGGRAVVRRNLATGATTVVANSFQGKRLNSPNDVTSDARGRICFTDARYISMDPMDLPNAVYRVDPNGRITQLATDIYRPNGIEVSPDGKRLYVAASNQTGRLPVNPHGPAKDRFGLSNGGVVAYDLDGDGNISNGRVFFRNDEAFVDGMATDTDGNLYLALHDGNREAPKRDIVVLNPDGGLVERLPLPVGGLTTNLGFGRGGDANSLYLTTAVPWRLYRIKTVRRGLYWD